MLRIRTKIIRIRIQECANPDPDPNYRLENVNQFLLSKMVNTSNETFNETLDIVSLRAPMLRTFSANQWSYPDLAN